MVKCPGQDQRFWKPEDIFEVKCNSCGHIIEFFKDEPKLKCRKCGQVVANPKIDLGCAEWCRYSEQCLGLSRTKSTSFMRDTLIDEMKKVFGEDQKKVEHALAVLNYAEKIQAHEDGDLLIVRAAAILHDVDIHEARRMQGSSASRYREIESSLIAEKILKQYDLDTEIIQHICKIIANHHNSKDIDSIEFRIVFDADQLVNIYEDFQGTGEEKLEEIIGDKFKTKGGFELAKKLFLKTDK